MSNGTDSTIVNMDWRSFVVKTPLYVNTSQYGRMDVNHPMDGFEKLVPEFAPKIVNTPLAETFNQPLLDFEEFGAPLGNWHFLFDATGAQAGASGFGFSVGTGGSKIVSIYSLGESGFREGTHSAKESSASSTIDNVNVRFARLYCSSKRPIADRGIF